MSEAKPITKRRLDTWLAGHRPADHGDRMLWDGGDGALKGFGVRQKPSGVASYILQYRNKHSISRRLTLARVGEMTAREARQLAATRLSEVRHGGDPAQERRADRGSVTVGELCDRYFAVCEERVRNGEMKESTLKMDRSRINTHVHPLLGRKAVASLTEPDIRRFVADVRDGKTAKPRQEGRGGTATGGPGVASRTLGMLKVMLELARRDGIIPASPAAGVRKLPDGRKDRALTAEEITALGKVMRQSLPLASRTAIAATEFILLTGFRRMEALDLERNWIDVANGCVRLPDSKTGRQTRVVGVAALAILSRVPQGRYVFPAERGGGCFRGLPKALARLCVAAGIKGGITVHTLRHTFATWASMLGYSEFTVAGLLGHRLGSVTARYSHVPDAALRAAADAVAAHITSMLAGKEAPKIESISTRPKRSSAA